MKDLNVSELSRDELAELTSKQLKELIRLRNEEVGTNPGNTGYLTVKGNKDELVDSLVHSEEINSTMLGRTVVESNRTTVNFNQLEQHEDNYRHAADYFDPKMQERYRKSGYKFFQELVVTPTGDTTEDGDPVYRVVSGNRARWNFKDVTDTDGVDISDIEIPVNIREYTDEDAQSAEIAEKLEIFTANEMVRRQSPVDRMKCFVDLSEAGLTQTAIAKAVYGEADYKNKQSIISKTMKLALLPDEILDLVHYDFNSAEFAANGVEFLDQYNIPYVVDEDGEITVLGMTQANAEEIMKLYPRTNSEGAEEGIEAVNKFVTSSDDLIEAACIETTSGFRKVLRAAAEEAGLLDTKPKKATTPTTKASSDEDPDDGDVAPDTSSTEAENELSLGSDDTKAKPSRPEYMQAIDTTVYEAATDLEGDQFEMAEDWADRFATLLHSGEKDSLRVFRFLRFHQLIEDKI